MAMIPSDYNPYGDPFDYGRAPRSREEYEYMRQKQMFYEQQARRVTAPPVSVETPKPSHLNPKLLLIKGA